MSATSAATKPTVLVFSQSGLDGGLKKTREKATVLQAYYNKPGDPTALLKKHPNARAIWIADPDIALPAHRDLSRQVVDYVRNGGGTVILGCYFSSLITPPNFDKWMRTAWDLPWRFGQYERTTVVFQPTVATGRGGSQRWRDGLAAAYSSKAVFLQNVAPEDAWYVSPAGSKSESTVFGPVSVKAETAIAFRKVGKGWLGYTGDVNNQEETTLAVLAMMGLNVDEDAEQQMPVNPAWAIMQQTGASEVSITADGISIRR